jgi:hypothetical protein
VQRPVLFLALLALHHSQPVSPLLSSQFVLTVECSRFELNLGASPLTARRGCCEDLSDLAQLVCVPSDEDELWSGHERFVESLVVIELPDFALDVHQRISLFLASSPLPQLASMDVPWNLDVDSPLAKNKSPPSSEAVFAQLDVIRQLQREIREDHAALENVAVGARSEDTAQFFDQRQIEISDIMSKVRLTFSRKTITSADRQTQKLSQLSQAMKQLHSTPAPLEPKLRDAHVPGQITESPISLATPART